MESKSVDTRSIYRELGATLSYNMRLGNGMEVEPWLKAAVRKEFVDDNRVKVNNDGNFVNDLSGRRGIYQAGIKASFSSSLSGHLGVGYSHGAGVESPWNAVAGVNWSFCPSTKKPTSVGFHITRSRGSFAYPFMSPHRLVGVLLRLLTSCFCWCCPCTVQS